MDRIYRNFCRERTEEFKERKQKQNMRETFVIEEAVVKGHQRKASASRAIPLELLKCVPFLLPPPRFLKILAPVFLLLSTKRPIRIIAKITNGVCLQSLVI